MKQLPKSRWACATARRRSSRVEVLRDRRRRGDNGVLVELVAVVGGAVARQMWGVQERVDDELARRQLAEAVQRVDQLDPALTGELAAARKELGGEPGGTIEERGIDSSLAERPLAGERLFGEVTLLAADGEEDRLRQWGAG